MTDMMLTGRVYDAEEGQRDRPVAVPGRRRRRAWRRRSSWPTKVAANAPLSNFAVHARACRASPTWRTSDGLFTESLMAAIAQGDEAAKSRMRAFLDGKAGKVKKA